MRNEEHLILNWSPTLLRRELDRWLWKEQPHLQVKQLWEYLCKYLYLPRLRDENVLMDAIRQGVNSLAWSDFFAYASDFDQATGRYLGLTAGQFPHITLDNASVLVKPEIAAKQLEAEAATRAGQVTYPTGIETEKTVASDDKSTPEPYGSKTVQTAPLLKRYHGSVQLAPTRLARDAGQIAEEVIQHLNSLVGAQVEVTLEINAFVPNGVPENIVRIVTENGRTLKFRTQGFEVE
jgi:hypothetical protein